VVKAFYHGEHANLALIDADEEDMKQIIGGLKDKFKRLPKEGYKEWDNVILNDKNRCAEIGQLLGPSGERPDGRHHERRDPGLCDGLRE